MHLETAHKLDDLVVSCTTALFEAHGWPVRLCSSADGAITEPSIVASIGFSGEILRGSLLLRASAESFRLSLPTEIAVLLDDDDATSDWAGELANQLLGRLKNQLAHHAVEVFLSTPVVVIGRELRHVAAGPVRTRDHVFAGETGVIRITLEAMVPADFVLTLTAGGDAGIAEGELALF